jgi:hypothetical protein
MTSLRTQLRSAREAYRSARYPGDLAAQILPKRSNVARPPARRLLLAGGVATSAAAAAVLLSLLMSRATDLPGPIRSDPSQRALVDWLPIRPEDMPLPRFQPPALPGLPSQVPGLEQYRDLARVYPTITAPLPDLDFTVPTLSDLPERGAHWVHKVWTGEKST